MGLIVFLNFLSINSWLGTQIVYADLAIWAIIKMCYSVHKRQETVFRSSFLRANSYCLPNIHVGNIMALLTIVICKGLWHWWIKNIILLTKPCSKFINRSTQSKQTFLPYPTRVTSSSLTRKRSNSTQLWRWNFSMVENIAIAFSDRFIILSRCCKIIACFAHVRS